MAPTRKAPGPRRSGRLERVAADNAVARAELVGLQRVEHAEHFLRVAADREVVDRSPADDALGIDDEGGAERDAGLLVEDAELGRELALDVRQPGERALAQVLAALAPGEMHEVAVGRSAEQLGVTVGEVA